MIGLDASYPGFPSGDIHSLVLPQETLLLYGSADAIVILNASSLALVRVLAFREAFPGTVSENDSISCITVDSGIKIIIAAMKTRIASWALSGVNRDSWRVHSSLFLPPDQSVSCLDSKSGLLAVGTENSLIVYTLILENDLPTWSQKWSILLQVPPVLLRFSHSLMYIATTSKSDKVVRLYSTTSGRQTQAIPHPRPVTNLSWRYCHASSRDDLILYTITSDATLRIFLPVLDSPQQLQLHAALNLFSSLPFSLASAASNSSVFCLDRQIISDSLRNAIHSSPNQSPPSKKLQDLQEEGWDLFLHALADGSAVITAVANIDRRPPTLLKQFTLQQSLPSVFPRRPSNLHLFLKSDSPSLTLVTSSPLTSYDLCPTSFFDAPDKGLHMRQKLLEPNDREMSQIIKFVRTPEGKGLGVIRSNGGGDVWRISGKDRKSLVRVGSWDAADHIVVFNGGQSFATYSSSTSALVLHLFEASDFPTVTLPTIQSLIIVPSPGGSESIIGITTELDIVHITVTEFPLSLSVHSHSTLPLPQPPDMILPVDPMGWGRDQGLTMHDILLSVSHSGELAFWVPNESALPSRMTGTTLDDALGWRCTGRVKTKRTGITRARCSSAKKTVLVVPATDGEELTIWDSQESEFASGLEYRRIYSDAINDLDWTSTPDMQSILAVGFLHHVDLLCQQRMTYFDEGPSWSTCWKVEIGSFIPYPIRDSIWLAGGCLIVGAGHQMFMFGSSSESTETSNNESLFEHVVRQNGPLNDYHPQMLLQCLLWDKVELVKDIVVNLAKDVEARDQKSLIEWTTVPVERFLSTDKASTLRPVHKKGYSILFDVSNKQESEDEGFSRQLVMRLIECLEMHPLPHLTPNEQAHLLVLIQTTLETDEQRRSLDSNGLRYLISMRSFYILNHRVSLPGSPGAKGNVPIQTGRRERLRYRDMLWAFHSESQDLLLDASTTACSGKMCWSDARALGVAVWLSSVDTMKNQMEIIARNEYMANDGRNVIACSLFYFALGKVKLVHGLWRQAAGHKEQAAMLKFLANDFTESRWRTAALKNAFALLGKQRFEYAAAFFLLGNSLQDAVNVCLKQLQDFQLAVALARVMEQSNEGPILCSILNRTVLPLAFREGNRWLASWAFWLLHRRDLAVRIIITPLQDIAAALDIKVEEIGEPHYDDPSLALLFSQLRSKTLQAAQGTSEISARSEFNFVLQIARVLRRMGCHVLALDLVRSWSFERPSILVHETSITAPHERPGPSSSLSPSRTLFALQHLRRRSSMTIDMDIPSLPPTRSTSPERKPPAIIEEPTEDGDFFARKAGIGSLMKTAKQNVKLAEFDMNAFF